jgi:hypothetical protein
VLSAKIQVYETDRPASARLIQKIRVNPNRRVIRNLGGYSEEIPARRVTIRSLVPGLEGNRITISGAELRGVMKVILLILGACVLHAQAPLSGWAFGGADHRLHYQFDARGNSIMDFSAAGYRAGGVTLPSAANAQRLTPAVGDNTARIQAALDKATGAVVLAAGEFEIAGTFEYHAQWSRAAWREGRQDPANGQATSFPGNPRRGHMALGRVCRFDPRLLYAGRHQHLSSSRRLRLPSR